MKWKKSLDRCRRVSCICLGNVMAAFGLAAFAVPHEMALTGVSGVSSALQHYFGINITMSMMLINLACFFLGFFYLGLDFALSTLISTIAFPAFYGIFSQIPGISGVTQDHFLAAVASGILFGMGGGLTMRNGGSTGGMDIPAIAISKKLHVPVTRMINLTNAAILFSQVLYSDSEQILYGVIYVMVVGIVLDRVMMYGEENIQVLVISGAYLKIGEIIQKELYRGFTFIPIETGYLRNQTMAVLCVMSTRELNQLNSSVQEIDPLAFVIVTNAREVQGKGFTLAKT